MKNLLLIFALSVFFVACGGRKSDTSEQSTTDAAKASSDSISMPGASQESTPEMPTVNATDISYRIFKNDSSSKNNEKGFGYDILNAGKIYVHQPHIPAVTGNKSFTSEEDASKAAALVAEKIKKGILPPTLSIQELDSMGIK